MENDQTVIKNAFTNVAKHCLLNNITSSHEAKQWAESQNPALKSDRYFQQIFELCFNIEQCRQKKAESDL